MTPHLPETAVNGVAKTQVVPGQRSGQLIPPPPPPRSADRIPSLDGLRGISIVLVILTHLAGTRHFFPYHVLIGSLGHLGVRIFFVLSGFLITTLLLEEYAESGRVSLPRFYFRRTLRIFPAVYAFLAVIFVLHGFGLLPLQKHDLLHALTYTMNYHNYIDRSWNVGHLWSLAVEEQFYLLWPAGIALLGPTKAVRLAVGSILAAPLFRAATWILLPGWREYIGEAFPTVCDSLASGCVLALIRSRLERHPGYVGWLSARALLWLPVVIVAFNAVQDGRARVSLIGGETFLNLMIALWIHRSVYIHTDGMGRFLNWGPCRYVGRLSYSVYIWQQVFLNRTSESLVTAFPVNLFLVAATGLASYYLVESPFLKWRIHLEEAWRRKAYPRTAHERDLYVSQVADSRQGREPGPESNGRERA